MLQRQLNASASIFSLQLLWIEHSRHYAFGNYFISHSSSGRPWLRGDTLASEANGLGSTPGCTLEIDTGMLSSFLGSVKCVVFSKQWVTAVEDCEGNCRRQTSVTHFDTSSIPSFCSVAISKQRVTAVEDCACKLPGVALPYSGYKTCGWQVTLCDPCLSATRDEVSCSIALYTSLLTIILSIGLCAYRPRADGRAAYIVNR